MRKNKLRKIWATGKPVLNGWLGVPSSFSAEVMAQQGWDSLCIDMQHGMSDYSDLIPMLQAISTTDIVPLARVPWLEESSIMRALDAGVYGIICPMVNTAEDAERFIRAVRYPPRGSRSFGPIRALIYGGADYPQHANEEVLAFAMIETKQAIDNLDEILKIPGLDAIYIGPADLANSMGHTPRFDPVQKEVVEAIDLILRKSKENNIRAGIHNGSVAYAQQMVKKGFDFVTIMSDARFMAKAAKEAVDEFRGGSEGESGGTY